MATGSQTLTTYYAKRIIGDTAAADAAAALLQTGANIHTHTWILYRDDRASDVYGIKYKYAGEDYTDDKIEFYGGYQTNSVNTPTAWIRLDTGDAYFLGHVGIGDEPDGTHQLYVNGTSYFTNTLTINNGSVNGKLIEIIGINNKTFSFKLSGTPAASNVDVGWDWTNIEGAGAAFRSSSFTSQEGEFRIYARKSNNGTAVYTQLIGTPGDTTDGGNLSWGGSASIGASSSGGYKLYVNGTTGLAGGHLYLTGAVSDNSTSNTTQIIFGTPTNNHVAISSNTGIVIINPTSTTTTGQIILRPNGNSAFTAGTLTINAASQSTYTLSVNGTSYLGGNITAQGNILPSATRTYNIGSDSFMWNDAHIRGIGTRHIDAATQTYTTDGQLHIGYGSVAPTKAIYLYYSTDTSSRTKFFEVNSNGAYAPTRFGVNGQSTDYTLYVNGTGYFTGNVTISHTASADMAHSSANPKITFSENGTQPVHLIYTDWDAYRAPAGLKVVGDGNTSSSSPAWFEVEGDLHVKRNLHLYRQSGAGYGTISFYLNTYKTWKIYMSNAVASGCPSGGTPSTLGDVTSWALRSYIENSSGYGWIWESAAESNTGTPTARMALNANNGSLTVSGAINAKNDLNLYTSSADSPDIVWWYADKGKEQARLWMGSGFSSKAAPSFREYKSDGTSLYSGVLPLGDGTGASGTWGISITGNADTVGSKHASSFFTHDLVAASTAASQDGLWGSTGSRSYHNVLPDGLSGVYAYGQVISFSTDNNARFQIYASHVGSDSQSIYFRTGWGNDKKAWRTILHSGNYTSYTVTKTGSGASGSWGISVTGSSASCTGNAATASKLTNITSSDAASSSATQRYVWFSYNDNATGRPAYSTAFTFQSSTGTLTATKVKNAVWNDYAECREVETEEPGYCVTETSTGIMVKTSQRLQAGCKITSDTYGSCMGETETAKTPIAVAGRVLVYPYKNREEYELGAAVCSAPNGTVDIMSRDEIMMYPERIVGTVSEIPDYEIWHGGSKEQPKDIEVNDRIWIYVR